MSIDGIGKRFANFSHGNGLDLSDELYFGHTVRINADISNLPNSMYEY